MQRQPTVFHGNNGIWVRWFRHPLRYLATANETGGKYCLSIGEVDLGQGASPHCHDFDEGFFILEGAVEFTAGNQKVLLQQGDFINVAAGTVHYPRGSSETRSKMLVVAAPCAFDEFQIRVGGKIESPLNFEPKSDDEMHRLVEDLAPTFGIDMHPTIEQINAEPRFQLVRRSEGSVYDVAGDRYRFLAEAEDTNGSYAIWHATVGPGGGPPHHVHRREEEGFFMLSGELHFEVNGHSVPATSGAFANMPIGSKHRFQNRTSQNAEMLILIAPGGLETMFQEIGAPVVDLNSPINHPDHSEIEKLRSLAGAYGIEIG
ncbi:cupin domain-containing protein [Pirellulaceae bacterium SH449]